MTEAEAKLKARRGTESRVKTETKIKSGTEVKLEYETGTTINNVTGIVIKISAIIELEVGPRFELTTISLDEGNTFYLHVGEAAGGKLVIYIYIRITSAENFSKISRS
ncbi:hypothetical protein EVAR_6271_1 [Eumeta japonica]|uniref:Uncharacterized protein n=1 Tax=Eumeta variegata TaxID=151549 RepID=A0A4C1TAW5_EUMVA|nr:hypothetical protein EVAR_6271_1 [Eumeta japonica]